MHSTIYRLTRDRTDGPLETPEVTPLYTGESTDTYNRYFDAIFWYSTTPTRNGLCTKEEVPRGEGDDGSLDYLRKEASTTFRGVQTEKF